jgi:SPP1 family predicted phage head-tail adaptor
MPAGLRNTKVVIQSATSGTSSLGGPTLSSWSTHCTEWAKVEDLQAGEAFDGEKRVASRQYRLTLPYNTNTASITSKMRVSIGEEYLNIRGQPENTGQRNREIVLNCEVRDDS